MIGIMVAPLYNDRTDPKGPTAFVTQSIETPACQDVLLIP